MADSGLRIVSGGQTGVDRGALDGALEGGLECGGWCPAGRRAEDGPIPQRYPLRELPATDYAQRTRRNVQDSDGTVVITFGDLSGGTALTARCAHALQRPLLVIDGRSKNPQQALAELLEFIRTHRLRALNFAGPRASGAPDGAAFTRELVLALSASLGEPS
jgi:hypothetical protein